MRRKEIMAKTVVLAFALGIFSSPVSANSWNKKGHGVRVNSFDGHIVFCAPQLPPVDVQVLPNGVEIVTFINIGNIWLTGHPLLDGIEENTAVATFDPASPEFTVKIKGKVDVAAVDGRWKFRQFLTVGPDVDIGYGIGFGFGDLRGKLMLFESGAPELIENSPCEVPVGAPISGKIISFGWFG